MSGLPQLDSLPRLDALDAAGWRACLREWLHSLPEGWRLPIAEYVMFGEAPPRQLRAALGNNFAQVVVMAENEDLPKLRNLACLLANACPAEAWGSPEAVDRWIAGGGVVGHAAADAGFTLASVGAGVADERRAA